jgi:hypothetical protein
MNYYFIAIVLLIVAIIAILLVPSTPCSESYNRQEITFKKEINKPTQNERKSNRVLIYNSFSYPNGMPEYAKYSYIITKAYADLHGYDYKQFNHESDLMPPYWLRVKDMYDILMEREYDVVVYLDLDATFYDFSIEIDDLVNDGYSFYVGADPFGFDRTDFNNLLNTGCFIVKRQFWTTNFVEMWLNGCMNSDGQLAGACETTWKYNNDKWSCPKCKWAGIKYEQGALANLYIMNVYEARNKICIFDEHIMSNRFPEKKSFVLHLMGTSDEERTNIFKKICEVSSL